MDGILQPEKFAKKADGESDVHEVPLARQSQCYVASVAETPKLVLRK